MKAISKQRGYSMLQLGLIIVIAGFIGKFLFATVPLFAENQYVESALTSLTASGEKLDDMTDAEIKKKLGNFYLINNVRSEGPTKNIVIDRKNNKTLVTVDYEARANFFWIIDVVVGFKNHLDSTRPNQCCKPAAISAK